MRSSYLAGLVFLSLFSIVAIAADDRLEVRDSQYYAILEPNSRLDCRYVIDDSFGFLFERGSDATIHVSLITNGQNEGSGSAFTAEIKTKALIGLHLYHFDRNGHVGRYLEFELRNQRNPRLNYRFSGRAMQVSSIFEKNADGTEKETLYPDNSRAISCEIL